MGKYINIALNLREQSIPRETGCFGGEVNAEVNCVKVEALIHVARNRGV
jgi:hypothetical protein